MFKRMIDSISVECRRLRIFSSVCLCLLLASIANSAAPAEFDSRSVFGTGGSDPLLYEVVRGKSRLYLFGTIHFGNANMYPLSDAVAAALEESEVIAMEVAPQDEEATREAYADLVRRRGEAGVDERLSARVVQLLERYRLPAEYSTKRGPLALSTILSIADSAANGLTVDWGTERVLMAMTTGSGKKKESIEPVGFALDLEFALTPQDQNALLQSTLNDIDSGEARRKEIALATTWQRGDEHAIEAVMQEALNEGSHAASVKMVANLARRNHAMLERIRSYLEEQKTYFVAVGIFHIVGSDGLAARLKRLGYSVRVVAPSSNKKIASRPSAGSKEISTVRAPG